MNTGTNAADSAACENRLLNRFGTWEASVNADAAAGGAEVRGLRRSRAPRPAIRESAVANAKIAVLTAIRRRGGSAAVPARFPARASRCPRWRLSRWATGAAIVRARRGEPPRRFFPAMANIHSQKKRILRAERERLENRRYTSKIKTYFRRLEEAVATGDDGQADTEHRELVQTIDKAVKRGALHRNTGARKKSRAARVRRRGAWRLRHVYTRVGARVTVAPNGSGQRAGDGRARKSLVRARAFRARRRATGAVAAGGSASAGMRFVRPTLTLRSRTARAPARSPISSTSRGRRGRRAVGGRVPVLGPRGWVDAELDVAPGITLPLPAPGDALPDADPIAVLPPAPAEARSMRPRPRHGASAPPWPTSSRPCVRRPSGSGRSRSALQTELARAEQLRKDVEGELERLKLNADGAVARRDAAVERFEDVAAERDEAVRELGDAVRERNEAVRERDAAVQARDEARGERDAAVRARDETLQQRDETAAAADAAVATRDAALAKGEQTTSAGRERRRNATRRRGAGQGGRRARRRAQRPRSRRRRARWATAERDRARSARSP